MYRVQRLLNNNVVQAVDQGGRQFVLVGRGVGHGRAVGEEVPRRLIEQVFVAESGDKADRHLRDLIADIPTEHLLVAGAAVATAHERLGITPSQSLLLPLADHLSFAVDRAARGEVMSFHPLRWEVRHLYPQEVSVGEEVLALVRERLRVDLPEDEAVALALHLVSAQFSKPDFAQTTKMTELIAFALTTARDALGLAITDESVPAARFVTHLRFLFARSVDPETQSRPAGPVAGSIVAAYPEAAACATTIAEEIARRTSRTLDENEHSYLTLHIARLAQAHRP